MSQTPVPVTSGSGTSSIAAELVGGTSWQQIEVYGGGGSSVLSVNPDGSIKASIIGVPTVSFSGSPSISGAVTIVGPSIPNGSVSGTAGASIIGQLPGGNAILGAVAASISGTVNTTLSGNPSISGTVNIGTQSGSVVGFQGGAWSVSIAGGFTTPFSPKASWVSATTSVITGTSPVSVLSAAGGSIKNYMSHILVTNGAAVGTFVDVKDGGGNVIYSGYAAASGGGFSSNINPPIPGSANKSVDVQPRAQASIIATISGYTDL